MGLLTGTSWNFSEISNDISAPWAHESTSLDISSRAMEFDHVYCMAILAGGHTSRLHLQRETCTNGHGKTTSVIPLIIFVFGEFSSPVSLLQLQHYMGLGMIVDPINTRKAKDHA